MFPNVIMRAIVDTIREQIAAHGKYIFKPSKAFLENALLHYVSFERGGGLRVERVIQKWAIPFDVNVNYISCKGPFQVAWWPLPGSSYAPGTLGSTFPNQG